jgi:hypothetical protein
MLRSGDEEETLKNARHLAVVVDDVIVKERPLLQIDMSIMRHPRSQCLIGLRAIHTAPATLTCAVALSASAMPRTTVGASRLQTRQIA